MPTRSFLLSKFWFFAAIFFIFAVSFSFAQEPFENNLSVPSILLDIISPNEKGFSEKPMLVVNNIIPSKKPHVIKSAIGICVSSNVPWDLSVNANSDLIDNSSGAKKTIPINRVKIKQSGTNKEADWTAVSLSPKQLVALQPPTSGIPAGFIFDYQVNLDFRDKPGSYTTDLIYTSVANIDISGAYPNPFSPDGDGVNDFTQIYYMISQDTAVTAKIFDQNNNLIKTLALNNLQKAGMYNIVWDGTSDLHNIVKNGKYLYEISGIVGSTIITIAKGLVEVNNLSTRLYSEQNASSSVFINKKVFSSSVVEIGDVVTYGVTLENTGIGSLEEVKINDILPQGFKYVPGSTMMNNFSFDDPSGISNLSWNVGTIASGEGIELTYRALVGIGTPFGIAKNSASVTFQAEQGASSAGPVFATVNVKEGIFSKRGTIIGKVFDDLNGNNIQDKGDIGLPKIKIYTEDGTFVITDNNGAYSIPNVRAGNHLIMIDKKTIPINYGAVVSPSKILYLPEGGLTKGSFGISHSKLEELPILSEDEGFFFAALSEMQAGYLQTTGNMDNFTKAEGGEYISPFYTNGRAAFYLKGKVKGDWLLTSVVDTANNSDISFDNIDPDKSYYIYGDDSVLGKELRGLEKLYVRLEKDKNYILYGDVSPSLSDTEFTKYSRKLFGLRTYLDDGKNNMFDFFGAFSAQVAVRDELIPNDTAGPYYLSKAPLMEESETIIIETREKDYPNAVIKAVSMAKDTDYSINYDTGSIIFKKAITPENITGDKYYIVVLYEYKPQNGQNYYTYGLRGKTGHKDLISVGTTYISEDHLSGGYKLFGIDTSLKLGSNANFISEYADNLGSSESSCFYNQLTIKPIRHLKLNFYQYQAGLSFYNPTNAPSKGTDIKEYGINTEYKINEKSYLTADYKQWKNNISDDQNKGTTFHDSFSSLLKYDLWGLKYKTERESLDSFKSIDSIATSISLGLSPKIWIVGADINYAIEDETDFKNLSSSALTNRYDYKLAILSGVIRPFYEGGTERKNSKNSSALLKETNTNLIGIGFSFVEKLPFTATYKLQDSIDYATNTNEKYSTIGVDVSYGGSKNKKGAIKYNIKQALTGTAETHSTADVEIAYPIFCDLDFYGKSALAWDVDKQTGNIVSSLDNSWVSFAYRPVFFDSISLLFNASASGADNKLVTPQTSTKKNSTDFNIIYTPGNRWTISGRFAQKTNTDILSTQEVFSSADIISGRVSFNLVKQVFIAGEYRLLLENTSLDARRGAQLELGYAPVDGFQIVGGYNFIDFSCGADLSQNYQAKGCYLKLTGAYTLSDY
ncbi:hypothetical protein A2310_02170 [candidate division WOR-1 bacterium RIFOXYB2_FULL_37_13]|uniref:DUF11 domain-containing protein n=1 Tax=candidate division WOR-1 bacterium RIFOXYB2_FULL_37_13 TaxID=1802579 RepID=A0A1F4SMD2_UNCSA|nr:MAG: hypothetical protein A2310_02170 [candidate division WOR-1 bacterium RIFOXYB2_FULL_37_13]